MSVSTSNVQAHEAHDLKLIGRFDATIFFEPRQIEDFAWPSQVEGCDPRLEGPLAEHSELIRIRRIIEPMRKS